MNNIGYRIMRGIIYALSLLPFRMLYVLSDILYVLVYKIVGYRCKTVSKNLRNSFPDKTKAELLKIERDFYHSFCDNMVEMFKLLSISPEEIHRRMTFSGNDENFASFTSDIFATGNGFPPCRSGFPSTAFSAVSCTIP